MTTPQVALSYILEKWQHAGFQRYFRNTGWMFGARVINILISLAVSAIVTRYLGPKNYGLISYVVSFVGLFSFLSGLTIDQAVYQFLIKYPNQEKEIIGTTLVVKFLSGLTAYICSIVLIFLFPHESIIKYMTIVIATPYVFQGLNVFASTFQSKTEAKIPSILVILTTIVVSIIKLFLVYFNCGVLFFSLVFIIDPFLFQFLNLLVYKKRYRLGGIRFNKKLSFNILKLSFPLIFSGVFVLIYSRIDQVMIKHMIDDSAVGVYTAMVGLAESWYFVPAMITNSLLPSIINFPENMIIQYRKRLNILLIFLVTVSILICLFITFFAKYIVLFLYGKPFIDGVLSMQIYVWAGIGIAVSAVLNQHLINKDLSKFVLYSSLIGMIVNVILNLIFIPKFGIVGAAISTLVSYSLVPLSNLLFPRVIKSLK